MKLITIYQQLENATGAIGEAMPESDATIALYIWMACAVVAAIIIFKIKRNENK